MFVFHSVRRFSPATRRLAAAALVALQGALTLAPLWEPAVSDIPVTHVEELGARHLDVHRDATCAVCHWRLLDSTPAVPAHLQLTLLQRHAAPSQVFAFGPRRVASPGRRTRAPPRES